MIKKEQKNDIVMTEAGKYRGKLIVNDKIYHVQITNVGAFKVYNDIGWRLEIIDLSDGVNIIVNQSKRTKKECMISYRLLKRLSELTGRI